MKRMREYLFRGKQIDSGEWNEGSLWVHLSKPYIMTTANVVGYEVDPETVGQYTGHICKNGKLFEGDIVKYKDSPPNLIRWNQDISGFEAVLVRDGVEYTCGICKVEDVEIIGNIHDNSGLLKEGGKND